MADSPVLTEDAGSASELSASLARLATAEHASDRVRTALLDLRDALDAPDPADAPFLTVIMRTRGTRPEPLRDALLCLAAQTDLDFEVVLLVHNATAEGRRDVEASVSAYPAEFAERVRVIPVDGGGRSRPLNVGLHESRGRYLVVFDDDDIVLAHWVETFRAAAESAPGRIIRAQTAVQTATHEAWPSGAAGFRTSSWPTAEYAEGYDPFRHFQANQTPFMSFAFPSFVFRKLGFEFDETLPVCEDWDMLLRASLICGVQEAPELTSIYRRWDDATSYTEHDQHEWDDARLRVLAKLDSQSILAPPGSATRISTLLLDENARVALDQVFRSKAWRWAWPLRQALRVGSAGRRQLQVVRARARSGR